MHEESIQIGELATQCGVNIQTIRYYERRGLLPEPDRAASNFRLYSPEIVQRLRFIKRAQELGFSLKEIADLLSLRVDPGKTCADVKRSAEAKLADIEGKMQSLRRVKRALTRLAAQCSGKGPTSACPILEALERRDL